MKLRLAPCFMAVLFVGLLLLNAASVNTDRKYTLTVIVEGVSNLKGVVGTLVFRSSAGWPESSAAAFRSQAVPAHPGSIAVSILDLPPGNYAVAVLHDENENMKLDRNWMGVPKEQWGMSRNPHVGLSAPNFDQAEFRLSGNMEIHITLN